MSALLEIRDMVRGFGGIAAIDGVSFDINEGEIVGLVGPNGSGKSTLFNCILGQLRPAGGEVYFRGQPITGKPPLKISRLGIGRTFQHLQVFPGLPVRENLIVAAQEHAGSLPGRLLGARDAGFGPAADEMLDFFRLREVENELAGSCSFGQQKLLDIAMAFMAGPKLVLLDEPAGGVNLTMLAGVRDHLRRMNAERGTTFVIIEHNMEFVMSLCERILVLAQGRLLAQGTPAEIRANPEVIEAYLGD
ncbi:MAG: ABC transporter ATP-binding protein [Alphaproteobacteria bacterium]